MIRYPNITGRDNAQKLDQVSSYLHQLVDELNYQTDIASGSGKNNAVLDSKKRVVFADTADTAAPSNFEQIKSLIIKNADIVNSFTERIGKQLNGKYVAVSDFGTYTKNTLADLEISADEIKSSLNKTEQIDDGEVIATKSDIKQTADSISLSVENGESSAKITLKVGDREVPATIDMTGMVTFTDLAEPNSRTEIDGSNITTGKISAEVIDAENLLVSQLQALDGNDSGISLNQYGLKRTSADGTNPLIDLNYNWLQTSGFLEEFPYLELFRTWYQRDVVPGELVDGGIVDGVHLDHNGIEFRSGIKNFTNWPNYGYEHTVDFGISRYGQVTGNLKVNTPTEDDHAVNKAYVDAQIQALRNELGL